jgi:amidase
LGHYLRVLIPADEYRRWDAVDMSRLLRSGGITPADLEETARTLLEGAADLNAVVAWAPSDRKEHSGPPARDTHGADRPPTPLAGVFDGVPFAVKELLAWPGLPWSMGSRMVGENPVHGFSPYTRRLSDLGLRVLCSTASSEFGILSSTESFLHGATMNPWGPGVSPGGSSGGSAALVAAGILPLAHGNDAGGSLRIPASLTGLVGFKPSNRRCAPASPGTRGFGSLVVEHVLTRSVRDSAHVLAATERLGRDAVHPPVGLVEGPGPEHLRVAVIPTALDGLGPVPGVRTVLDKTADLMVSLGHEVTPVESVPVDGRDVGHGYYVMAGEMLSRLTGLLSTMSGRRPGPDDLEPFTRELIAWADSLGPTAPARAERSLAVQARAFLSLFDGVDVILTPTVGVLPWAIGDLAPDAGREVLFHRAPRYAGYTAIHNPAGCPAISLPLGEHGGLPIGMQFAAAPGRDATVLGLAYQVEAAAPWTDRYPWSPTAPEPTPSVGGSVPDPAVEIKKSSSPVDPAMGAPAVTEHP